MFEKIKKTSFKIHCVCGRKGSKEVTKLHTWNGSHWICQHTVIKRSRFPPIRKSQFLLKKGGVEQLITKRKIKLLIFNGILTRYPSRVCLFYLVFQLRQLIHAFPVHRFSHVCQELPVKIVLVFREFPDDQSHQQDLDHLVALENKI